MKGSLFIFLAIHLCIDSYSQSLEDSGIKIKKRTFVYKMVGEVPIRADLFQTTGDNALKPVIIWIHGGALIFGSRTDLPEEQMKFYLKAGYSVVSIDYRLAPRTKLPEIVDDVKDAVQWIRVNGSDSLSIDSKKIFIIGHSGGAYLALMSGYILKNPPQGIVSFYGYGDIQSEWYNKPDSFYRTMPSISEEKAAKLNYDSVITTASRNDRRDLYVYSRQKGLWPLLVSDHNPVKEGEWFDRYCPIKNINTNYPPVLLIHGDKDTDVPFEQSVLMDKELELKKIKHKFIIMKNYDHVFDLRQGGLSNPDIYKVFNEVIAFLNNCR